MTAIVCTSWTPSAQNTRRGFVDISLPDSGIILRGVVLHQGAAGKRWVSWPATQTGRGYSACAKFMATVEHDAWQQSALAAIDSFVAGLDGVDAGGHELPALL